jgi:hypothetical protein
MGTQNLIIHPADWRYRADTQRVIACIHLLQRTGVMGGPMTQVDTDSPRWRPELRLEDQLGIPHRDPAVGSIGIVSVPPDHKFEVMLGPVEVACPTCGKGVMEEWGSLMGEFYDTETEPMLACSCGATAALTKLQYSPGAAFVYFAVIMEDVGYEVDTTKPLWRELEQVLDTNLVVTKFKS